MTMTHLCKCNPCRCAELSARPTGDAGHASSEAPRARPRGAGERAARRPALLCRGQAELAEPALGAHLITRRRGYTHHGIYAGDGEVLHYAGLSRSIRRGPVAQVPLAEFANGRPVQIECRSERALEGRQIVARARSRLGENRYRLLTNNCEHFSEWSRFGVSRSAQVQRWVRLPGAVVQGLLARIAGGASMAGARAQRATA